MSRRRAALPGGSCFLGVVVNTANVYIDGFNLYYGALKGTQYKWLDLGSLCRNLLPTYTVKRIRYFTARVSGRPDDPQLPQRQQTYLRALETIPNLTIHFGQFRSRPVRLPVHPPPNTGPKTVQVLRTEEKGSDVNLATHLLLDGFAKDASAAFVMSDDSDLLGPVEATSQILGLHVGILNPQVWRKRPNRALQKAADSYRPIRNGVLGASQFPTTLTDSRGTITKPNGW